MAWSANHLSPKGAPTPMSEAVLMIPFNGHVLAFTLPEIATARRRAETLGLDSCLMRIAAPAPIYAAAQQPEPWLTSKQLAAQTGIGDTTLEGWAKQGKIPSFKAGKALRFKVSEVEAALRAEHADSAGFSQIVDCTAAGVRT